jgi:hypothetical protein
MSQTNPADNIKPVINFTLWALVIVLAFVNVFVTFRGLATPSAMEEALIARELARGHGFTTKVITPAVVQQMQAAGRKVDMVSMPDTLHPPLQSLLLAPVYKALEKMWSFDRGSSVYVLDRVTGAMGACWMLLTLVLAHGLARRLFDRTLASFAVLALAASKPMWDMAITMGSRGLLMFLTTLCLYWLSGLIRRASEDEPLGMLPFGVGLACAAMVLTHWMAVWIVLGVVIAVAVLVPGKRGALFVIGLLPMLAIGGWCAHNLHACGDMLGATKALLQSTLSPQPVSVLLRDYENVTPSVNLTMIGRSVNANLATQTQLYWEHMLGVAPAVLFFLALLHRFRRQDVAVFRWAVGLLLLSVIIGTALIGLPGKSVDDNQIHAALVPVLTVLGLAGFAVLWARFAPGRGGIWTQHGYAILAIVVGGWPMLMGVYVDLRLGLFFKDQLMQWPPYRPDTISLLNRMVKEDELLASDAPWAVAWYADRACLWLPKNREQFTRLTDIAKSQKHPLAGFVITPVATQDNTFITQFSSAYGDWMELIARGPLLSIGPEMQKFPSGLWMRDYGSTLPLGAVAMPDGRRVPAVTFFSDHDRWSAGQLK